MSEDDRGTLIPKIVALLSAASDEYAERDDIMANLVNALSLLQHAASEDVKSFASGVEWPDFEKAHGLCMLWYTQQVRAVNATIDKVMSTPHDVGAIVRIALLKYDFAIVDDGEENGIMVVRAPNGDKWDFTVPKKRV